MKHKIGYRTHITEDQPLDQFKIHQPCLVLWGYNVMHFKENSMSDGYIGTPENKTYGTCTLEELNGSRWVHAAVTECYRIIKTDSKALQWRFNLQPL